MAGKTDSKESVRQAEDYKTVTVRSKSTTRAGLWDRSPAYKNVKGAERIVVDEESETYEIFVRNEPVTLPRTPEVEAALKAERLVEA